MPYGAEAYTPAYTADQEMDFLRNQAKAIGDQLESIQNRISELEEEARKEIKK
jgi:hypothetical protein